MTTSKPLPAIPGFSPSINHPQAELIAQGAIPEPGPSAIEAAVAVMGHNNPPEAMPKELAEAFIAKLDAHVYIGKAKGLDEVIAQIREAAATGDNDLTTQAGRDAIRSRAFSVVKAKTTLTGFGEKLMAGWKAKTKAVKDEVTRASTILDQIEAETRKPLTDWENADKVRKDKIEADLQTVTQSAAFFKEPTLQEIDDRIALVQQFESRDWEEKAEIGKMTVANAMTLLQEKRTIRAQQIADQAELERLRQVEATVKAAQEATPVSAPTMQQAVQEVTAAVDKRLVEPQPDPVQILNPAPARFTDATGEAVKTDVPRAIKMPPAGTSYMREKQEEGAAPVAAPAPPKLTDTEFRRAVNGEVLFDLTKLEIPGSVKLDTAQAKAIIVAIVSGNIRHTNINYQGR